MKLNHLADPQSRPVVIIIFTGFARMSIRTSSLFKILQKTKLHMEIMIATGGTVGLAEGIFDDTCLLFKIFIPYKYYLIYCY